MPIINRKLYFHSYFLNNLGNRDGPFKTEQNLETLYNKKNCWLKIFFFTFFPNTLYTFWPSADMNQVGAALFPFFRNFYEKNEDYEDVSD